MKDSEEASTEEKIQFAKQLLAQVLHNLKTSDLIQLTQKEDVPRVVYEMTRSVCGVKEEQVKSSQSDVEMNLDKAFGLGKQ